MDSQHKMEENGDSNYTLTVRNIRESDLGNYTCNAVNKIGEGSATITLSGMGLIEVTHFHPFLHLFVFHRHPSRFVHSEFIQRSSQDVLQLDVDFEEFCAAGRDRSLLQSHGK